MSEQIIFLLVLMTSVPLVSTEDYTTDDTGYWCPNNSRINLNGETVDRETGDTMKTRYKFPAGSTWNESNETFGCACYSKPICALMLCPEGRNVYAKVDRDCQMSSYNWVDVYAGMRFRLEPSRGLMKKTKDIRTRDEKGKCEWMNIPVDNVKFAVGGLLLRKNGSIYSPHENIVAKYRYDPFCLCRDVEFKIYEPTCTDDEPTDKNMASPSSGKKWFYPSLNLLIAMGIVWSAKIISSQLQEDTSGTLITRIK